MSVGSAFDERALELNVRRQWREWSGVFSSSAYAPHIDIEYNAIRNAAALIDVSPLFKYRVSGPDADRLVDRVITRSAAGVKPGRVMFEMAGVSEQLAREAMRLAAHKLPIKTQVIARFDLGSGSEGGGE